MTRDERDRLRRQIQRRERTSFELRHAHAERVRRRVFRLGWRPVRVRKSRTYEFFVVVEKKSDPDVFDVIGDGTEALESWLDAELSRRA